VAGKSSVCAGNQFDQTLCRVVKLENHGLKAEVDNLNANCRSSAAS